MDFRDKIRPILALVFGGLALFLLVSLLTHEADDSRELVWPAAAKVANQCGRIGAFLSERLFFAFGWAAYWVAFTLLGWAFLLLVMDELPDLWARLLGSSLILLCVAVVAGLQGPVEGGTLPGRGGVIGEAGAYYLLSRFGRTGTYLVAGVVAGISLVLATETLLVRLARGAAGTVSAWLAARAAARAVPLAEHAREEQAVEEGAGGAEAEEATLAAPAGEGDAEAKKKEEERERRRIEREAARRKAELEAQARAAAAAEAARKARAKATCVRPPAPGGPFQLPSTDLLEHAAPAARSHKALALEEKAELLEAAFEEFGIQATVVNTTVGPTITQFECELGAGIKLSRVTALSNDLAMALQATSVRIVAPLPGKGTFGVEIPNDSRQLVRFRELLESGASQGMALPLVLGKEIGGKCLVADLDVMPHLLIAGTTGSGKSYCVNAIIISLLYHRTPAELKMILVDPKQVELAPFAQVPHLICPTVTESDKAAGVLDWAVQEMERRYLVFRQVGCRDITGYHKLTPKARLARWVASGEDAEDPGDMPYVVVVIDELADLMYTAGKAVESSICRLAQKSRAAGLHLVLATQRPSVDVVTGLIKANLPCRLSFRVNSNHDSKVILDTVGADKLLGKGDLLYKPADASGMIRAQGAFLSDEEVSRVVGFVSAQAQPQFHEDLMRPKIDLAGDEEDPMFNAAVRVVLEQQRGSASLLQRALAIGYTRASRLIDIMGERGILGPHKGSKCRELLVTLEEWEEMCGEAGAEVGAGAEGGEEG